jgi:hypothetical protein
MVLMSLLLVMLERLRWPERAPSSQAVRDGYSGALDKLAMARRRAAGDGDGDGDGDGS